MVMPYSFNLLYAQVADSSRASLDEKVEAFVRLAYWTRDPDLEIVKQEEVKIEKRRYTFNRRVIMNLDYNRCGIKQIELLMVIDRDQIRRVEVYEDGKKRSLIKPHLIGAGDQINLQISGPNVLHTSELHNPPYGPYYDHYYVVVSEDGAATDNSLTLQHYWPAAFLMLCLL